MALVLDEGKSVTAVARELDLVALALGQWVKQARADRSKGRTGLTTVDEWIHTVRCFKKRHVIAHKLGVMDALYVQNAGDPNGIAGRKVSVSKDEVESFGRSLGRIGEPLTKHLGL